VWKFPIYYNHFKWKVYVCSYNNVFPYNILYYISTTSSLTTISQFFTALPIINHGHVEALLVDFHRLFTFIGHLVFWTFTASFIYGLVNAGDGTCKSFGHSSTATNHNKLILINLVCIKELSKTLQIGYLDINSPVHFYSFLQYFNNRKWFSK
jgi:hypothetical protein